MGRLLLLQLSVVTVSLSAGSKFGWYRPTSDMLFDAKCDTDNAGELLETPTKLR